MIKDFEGKPENLCLRTLHLLFGVYNLYPCRAFAWAKFADANVQKADHILMGEIMVKVIPRREYLVKAGATGEIKLDRKFIHGGMVEAGQQLGGIDLESHLLQKELLEIEESLFEERQLPQSKLQRISEIEKFKEKLARLESEAKLTRKFIDDPSLFSKVYQEEVGEGNFPKNCRRHWMI